MGFDEAKQESIFEKARGYGALFSNQSFCMLWLAQIFSQFADRIIFVVFVTIIAINFDPTGKSASLQSWLYIAFTIPAILLTAVAGVFIDVWNKKAVMIITNILRGIIILLLPLFDKTLLSLYALAFLMSSVTQFFVPAEAAIIPSVANKYQLLTANSLFSTTMMASLIFGFALGDPMINICGINFVHYGISLFFFLSALCLCFVNYKTVKKDKENKFTFLEDLIEGLVYIKDNPIVRSAMLKLASLFSVIVMLSILSISLSQNYLYPQNPTLGAQKFAYIVVYCGIGMVFGAFLVGHYFRKVEKHLLGYIGILTCGIALALFGVLPLIPQTSVFHFETKSVLIFYLEQFDFTYPMLYSYIVGALIGVSTAFVAIPTQTILHTEIDPKVRGKVFGILFTLLSTASALPVLIAAWGAQMLGVARMMFILATPALFFSIFKLITYKNKFGENA
ncbi:MAG TPA: MFS transporter [Candidatus Gastranaerophilaceae bacterium]|nr:MFS transporter [Candidatus Gastranaerophilaceae bacterium]HPT41271.1 MFS transporter [Candidatus Gastranaerophilaceae bacterium]